MVAGMAEPAVRWIRGLSSAEHGIDRLGFELRARRVRIGVADQVKKILGTRACLGRARGRRRAQARLPADVRQQLLDAIYAGQPFRAIVRDLGLTSNQV
jgi:hypothetical protein